MDNNMNLYEKLAEAEKVAKANAKAKIDAEEKAKAQQKARQDDLMARIGPAAEALKRFIEGSEGQAVIRFLKQTGGQMSLGYYEPTGLAGLAFLRDNLTEWYFLSGEGIWVKVTYDVGSEWVDRHEKTKTRIARWGDYVNICKYHALKGEDPFCVIEVIKATASKWADSLLGSDTK